MNPARFRWGILFIVVGSLLILNNFNYLDWDVWEDIVSLWPLILIAIGVEKIFANSKAQAIAYLPSLILAVIVFFVAFNGLALNRDLEKVGGTYRYQLEMKPEYKSLEARFSLDNTDLTIWRASADDLFRGRFGRHGKSPRIDFDVEKGTAILSIHERQSSRVLFQFGNDGFDSRWSAELNGKLPLKLVCTGDNADMNLNCGSLRLRDLQVESEDGDVRISIGDLVDTVIVSLDGDDADFALRIPEKGGIRITGADEDMARLFRRVGLTRVDDTFETEGFDTLTPKIMLDMSRDISQFSLNYY